MTVKISVSRVWGITCFNPPKYQNLFLECRLRICNFTWLRDYRRVLDWQSDVLDSYTTRDYASQITIRHKPVFSVTLFGNGFQRWTFFSFRADVSAGWRPSYASLVPSLQTVNLTDCPRCHSTVLTQVKVTLRPTISRSVSPGFEPHVGLVTGY
jgi:hypothetical protein